MELRGVLRARPALVFYKIGVIFCRALSLLQMIGRRWHILGGGCTWISRHNLTGKTVKVRLFPPRRRYDTICNMMHNMKMHIMNPILSEERFFSERLFWCDVNPKSKDLMPTDLGSLIGNTQCGTFRIFLPLIFYVKSILVVLKPKNCYFDN